MLQKGEQPGVKVQGFFPVQLHAHQTLDPAYSVLLIERFMQCTPCIVVERET